ncbi:MAG: hypothetical protein K8R99_12725 [Actinomycetia bacterium]|nr:hypothetical protein [Actinomycetes bacterium]
MSYGRVVLSAFLTMLLMLFVAADLVLFGVLPLNSIVVTILPLAGLVLGAVLAIMARKRQSAGAAPAQTAAV